tara:strand:+ start:99 stop:695 length:597 start_codon:yes stop_codon:yes gene_type:complete
MRKNYKLYDSSYIIPDDLQCKLDTAVATAPTQLCNDSNRYSVIRSSRIDTARHSLAPLIFGNTSKMVWEAAPLTSSCAYFFAMLYNEQRPWHPLLHIGLVSGMLVSRALELGLDASFIACSWDTVDHKKVNKVLHTHYTIPAKTKLDIQLVVCIGRGIAPGNRAGIRQPLGLLTGQKVRYINAINTSVGLRPQHYLTG